MPRHVDNNRLETDDMGWFLFIFGLVRLAVSVVNWVARLYLPEASEKGVGPVVSVLIPARNEEKNIANLLSDLQSLSYPSLEILVYDDLSTDRTADIVQRFATARHPVRLIPGIPPPIGWLGKNWACYRLSLVSTGKKLLFLDADVRIKGEVITRALTYMHNYQLQLLSVFPTQRMPSWGSRLAVPLMNWILLSLLPLPLVRLSSHPALSAANGQFLFFEAGTYRRLCPHRLFKNNRVEDMAIMKKYKEERLPVATLLGGKEVCCTMYTTLAEAVEGFSKNIFQFFGGSGFIASLFGLLTTVAPFYLFGFMGGMWGGFYVCVVLLNHLFVTWASHQSVKTTLGLLIPRQFIFLYILYSAFVKRKRKSLRWKGRYILREPQEKE